MSTARKYLVLLISGLFLCPIGLELSFLEDAGAAFIDTTPAWESVEKDFSGAVSWGDVDNDGDLDLAVGNYGQNYIYLNDNGTIPTTYAWISNDNRDTFCLDWGDFDSDGDIDLAAGNRFGNDSIYLNENGGLLPTPIWNSSLAEFSTSVQWGDIDSDGDLDLVVCHYQYNIAIYLNNGGKFDPKPSWTSEDTYFGNSVLLGDINGDDKLDMIIGNGKLMGGAKNYMYFNKGTGFNPSPDWETKNPKRTIAMDLGDYDCDGDLDLALGTLNMGTIVHDNINNNLTVKPSWTASDTSSSTYGIAWADVTGNGYLDLILANNGKNMIYKNNEGVLENYASWYSDDSIGSSTASIGDYDGDADLDLAFSSDLPDGPPTKIYENNVTLFSTSAVWSNTRTDRYNAAGWYDIDSDGDLDLAIGGKGRNRIFYNRGTQLYDNPAWSSSDSSDTRAIAWGDLDSDGDLDLVAGNYAGRNIAYRNNYGSLMSSAWWSPSATGNTTSVALGDIDTDGDLDLAVGNFGGSNSIYLNTGSGLETQRAWSSNDTANTTDLAWGDMDNDGNLELAVANSAGGLEIFHNHGNSLSSAPIWTSSYVNDTRSVAWADINLDGFLDLVTGAYGDNLHVYYNDNGSFDRTPSWRPSAAGMNTTEIYPVDINGDGAVDLFEVNDCCADRIFMNYDGVLGEMPVWESATSEKSHAASFGDMDSDSDFDFAVVTSDSKIQVFKNTFIVPPVLVNNPPSVRIVSPTGLLSNSLFSFGLPYQDNIAIKYILYDPEGAPAWIEAEYSVDGGGTWIEATPSSAGGDPTTGLAAAPGGKSYTFLWDSKQDNVVSKNVMFKIKVYAVHDTAGAVQRPFGVTYAGVFPVDSPKIFPPLNLRVSDPTTHSLLLTWNPPIDYVTSGYEIFMNRSNTGKNGPFELRKQVGVVTHYNFTGLADDTTYYFKIRNVDNNVFSTFSNLAWGTTIPSNLPPRKLKSIPDVEMEEDTKLFNYFNLNEYYWDEFLNVSSVDTDGINYELVGGDRINAWISPSEWLSIEPPPNYFGRENFTVVANDSVFTTEMTFNVTVNSVNDRPILNLTDGSTLYGIQNQWINLTVTAYDPADPHDALKFSDNSTLFDIEADTGNISYNPLPWDIGTFYANITVTDSGEPNLQSWAYIVIVVNATESPPESEQPISTLVYPEPGSIVTTLRPTLMWDGRDVDSEEIWYDVYLAPDKELVHDLNTFTRILTYTRNITFTLTDELTNGFTYYWTVIPHDGITRGTCESGIWQFTIDVSQDSPVVNLISPSHNEIINLEAVRLSWGLEYKGTEPVKYFVYFDTSPVPKTLISSEVNVPHVDVTELQDGEQYFWTVIPRAGNIIGSCSSGIRAFKVNFDFISTYGISLIVNNRVDVKINETKLHDVTIINEGNNVDTFLVSLTAGALAGSVSLKSEWLTLTNLGSGFIELEPFQALTVSLLFGIHDEALLGLHFTEVEVRSLGADYAALYIADEANITVNVMDASGKSFIDDFKPDDQPNGTADPGNSNSTGDDSNLNPIVMSFNWSIIIFAIIFAIIIVIIYTMYLMRKTKKKFEVYRTAQEILESKDIDSAHPIVAGFLTENGQITASDSSGIGDVELTAAEAATLKEAFAIGTGRYRQAQEELMIIDKPYSAAASRMSTEVSRPDAGSKPGSAPAFSKPVPGSYEPEYVSPPPKKPYAAAAKIAAEFASATGLQAATAAAAPMAMPVAKSDKKGPYQPDHIEISSDNPYETAGKMQALEQKLKDGKISKKLFDELALKYAISGTTKPVTLRKGSYEPNYMHLRAEKPYDNAAKMLKLEQKFREGKISKRLYEELKSNYV